MQIQELEYLWKRLDEKVDKTLAIESELLRRVMVEPVHRRINRMAIWPALDVVLAIAGIGFTVSTMGNHWLDSRVLVPVVMLVLGFLALFIDSIFQLSTIYELDWSGPVATIQHSLAQLRTAKVRQFKWIMLLSPLWLFCGLIVLVEWFSLRFTGDPLTIVRKFDANWLVGNFVVCGLIAVVGALIVYACSCAFKHRSWWQAALDDISGKTLTVARKDMELWASLQADPKEDL
jgi:hypothetical protein